MLQKKSKILPSHIALCLGRESLRERPGEAMWDRKETVKTKSLTFSSAYVCWGGVGGTSQSKGSGGRGDFTVKGEGPMCDSTMLFMPT